MQYQFSKDELKKLFEENGYGSLNNSELETIMKQMRKNSKEEAKFHRAVRSANHAKADRKKKRAARTHKLCTVGGAVLKFYPMLSELYPNELEQLFDEIFNYDSEIDSMIHRAIENRKNKGE